MWTRVQAEDWGDLPEEARDAAVPAEVRRMVAFFSANYPGELRDVVSLFVFVVLLYIVLLLMCLFERL